jgi:hypothetical protein
MKKITTILIFIMFLTNIFSQGRIWVSIPNYDSNSKEINQSLNQFNITKIEKAFSSSRSQMLQTVYELECNCDEALVISQLKNNSNFVNPEVGPKYEELEVPNDYSVANPNQWALNLIEAPLAWDITKGSSEITIAITDANYYITHEDLIDKVDWITTNNGNTNYAHGTAVANIAGGKTNNSVGMSSLGYNSRLQLRTMTYNEMLNATYSGAKVINASWMSSCSFNSYAQSVVDEVYNNGSIIVASAGNGSTCGGSSNLVYPASYNHVISVTSVGLLDNHERIIGDPNSTHQHNSMVDICAPGYDVPLTTAPGVYTTGNGTSFASPFVSATVALMLSVNPCLNPDEIELILKNSADTSLFLVNSNYSTVLGAGRLNAKKALEMAKSYSTLSGILKVSVDCVSGVKSVMVDNLSGVSPYIYTWSNSSNNESVTVDTTGLIFVEITDSLGCRFVDSIFVEKYNVIESNETVNNVLCFGMSNGQVSLEITGGEMTNLPIWNTGDTTRVLSNISSGTYFYSISDSYSCEYFDSVTVGEPEKLIATIDIRNQTETELGSINVSVFGGIAPYEYIWNTGDTTEDLINLTSNFYELLIEDQNGCKVSTNGVLEYEENNLSVSEIDVNDFTIYPNPSNGRVVITSGKDDDCNLSVVNATGQIENYNKTFTKEVTLENLSTGLYLVTVDGVTKKLIVK